MPGIRAVAFDIYRTLIDISTDEESLKPYEFLSRWLSYHGVETDAPALRSTYLELCDAEISKGEAPYPDIDIGTVFTNILRKSRHRDLDLEGKSRELALLFRMATTNSISLYPGVHDVLQTLRGKIRLGIVSNAQRLFTVPELSKFSLIDYFDRIVLSSDFGVRKPDPQIFEALLSALRVPPETVVFIGDNPFDDIHGASQMGMRTVWIRHPDHSGLDAVPADYTIEAGSFAALSEILLPLLQV